MEVSPQEQAITKPGIIRGGREAVESNHVSVYQSISTHAHRKYPSPWKTTIKIGAGDLDWRVRGRNDSSHEGSWWHS